MIARFDHLVLSVGDVNRSAAFYERLGMRRESFGDGRIAVGFGAGKLNLNPGPPVAPADFCLVSELSLDALLEALARSGVEIELGPVDRHGALGSMLSVYLRDPDGNLVEISTYPSHTS